MMNHGYRKLGLMSKTIFACVRWGDKFSQNFVTRLYDMVERNYRGSAEFWCLTDDVAHNLPSYIKAVPLPSEHGLEAWWNKMYLFHPDMFPAGSRIVFLDLDVVIQRDITSLVNYYKPYYLTLIDATWKIMNLSDMGVNQVNPSNSYDCAINSSVMVWTAGELDQMWTHFEADYDFYIIKYRGIDRWLVNERMPLNYLPDGIVYSRLFGVDATNRGPRVIGSKDHGATLEFELFDEPDYPICIFNGYGSSKNAKHGIHLDDSAYTGFEKYWI